MKQVGLRLSDDLHRDLVESAKRYERTLHSEIIFALREYLRREKRERERENNNEK